MEPIITPPSVVPASQSDAFQKNIEAINNNMAVIQQLPQILQTHQLRTSKAVDTGLQILAAIQEQGMTDALFESSKAYIIRCRDVKLELEAARKPGTQSFDLIRNMFTTLESLIEIKTPGTAVFMLQAKNSKFVADRAERERKEQEERDRQAKKKIEAGQAKADYEKQIDLWLINNTANMKRIMQDSFNKITLVDFEVKKKSLQEMNVTTNVATIAGKIKLITPMTMYNSPDEVNAIGMEVWNGYDWPKYMADYQSAIQDLKTQLIADLPGKKIELENIAKANAEEKQRLENLRLQREADELKKQQDWQKFQESQANAKADTAVQNTTVTELFNATPQVSTPPPAMKTTTKIRVKNHTGVVEIFTQWYKVHSSEWSLEDLTAKVKFMITDLEADARKADGEKIVSANVEYYQDITSSNRKPVTKNPTP